MTRQQHIEGLRRAIAKEEISINTLYDELDIGDIVALEEHHHDHRLRLDKQKVRKEHLARLLSKPS